MAVPLRDFVVRRNTIISYADEWAEKFGGDKSLRGNMLNIMSKFITDLNGELDIHPELKDPQKRDYYLSEVTDLFDKEWDIISRYCLQHLNRSLARPSSRSKSAQDSTPGNIRSLLQRAESYAMAYFSAFKGYKPDGVVPLVFFDSSPRITRLFSIPYPMISIRFTYFREHMEWQALAHEVGHYIYSHTSTPLTFGSASVGLDQFVRTALQKSQILRAYSQESQNLVNETVLKWLEETFADVCGALLAGPSFVDTSININWGKVLTTSGIDKKTLLEHDNKHPAYFVRPLIALQALEWVQKKYASHRNAGKLSEFIASRRAFWKTHIEDLLAAPTAQTLEPDDESTFKLPNEVEGTLKYAVPPTSIQMIYEAVRVAVNLMLEGDGRYGNTWEAPEFNGAKGPFGMGKLPDYLEPLRDPVTVGKLIDCETILDSLDEVKEITLQTVMPSISPMSSPKQPSRRSKPVYEAESLLSALANRSKIKRDTPEFLTALFGILVSDVGDLVPGQDPTGATFNFVRSTNNQGRYDYYYYNVGTGANVFRFVGGGGQYDIA